MKKKILISLVLLSLIFVVFKKYDTNFDVLVFEKKVSAFENWGIKDLELPITSKEYENIAKTYLSHEYLEKNILKIIVNTKNIADPLIGMAFHLNFESEKLAFLKYLPLDFFEKAGDPLYLLKENNSKLIFGATLKKDDLMPLGEGEVVEFYFEQLAPPPYNFSFENAVLATMDPVLQDLEEVFWENYEVNGLDSAINLFTDPKKTGFIQSLKELLTLKNISIFFLIISVFAFSAWIFYIYKFKKYPNQKTSTSN